MVWASQDLPEASVGRAYPVKYGRHWRWWGAAGRLGAGGNGASTFVSSVLATCYIQQGQESAEQRVISRV